MQLNRDELRKKLSREYVGDGRGFLLAEAKELIRSGNSSQLEDYHLEVLIEDRARRIRSVLTIVPTVRPF